MHLNACIVIPVYNHRDTMLRMAPELDKLDLPCIMVNDGSDAETTAGLEDIAVRFPHFQHVKLSENQGKGGAVMAGFEAAREQGFTHAVQIDADYQHHLEDIPKFIAKATAHPEALILGKPQFDQSIPKARLRGRYLTHICVWIECLSKAIADSMCGFRVYPLSACKRIKRLGRRMDFDTEIAVKLYWMGVEVINIDTPVTYHSGGISHFRMVHDNVLISWMHIRLIFGMILRSPKLLWRRLSPSDTHWSEQKERGSYLLLRLSLFLYKIFGRWVGKIIVCIVVSYFFATSRKNRRASQKYLKRLYAFNPEAPGFKRPPRLTDSFLHNLEFGNAILNRFSAWMGQIVRGDIIWENRPVLTDRIAKKQGGVLIGAHMGNLEVIRAVIQGLPELKFNALVYIDHAPRINEMLQRANPNNSINIISLVDFTPDVAIMLKEKVDQGEYVVILSDRIPAGARNRQATVDFLGHPASLPEGPMILASLLDCPVFLIFCLRTKGAIYEVFLETFAEERLHFPRKDREKHIQAALQRYAKRLEVLCGIAPLQWFNFFDFWQD
jgi:predicted LPLAT superfamily acyltransferase